MNTFGSSRRHLVVASCLLLFLVPAILLNGAVPAMRLFFDNMAATNFSVWEYDIDSPTYVHGDGNPFTYDGTILPNYHVFAYANFNLSNVNQVTCTFENLDFADSPDQIHLTDFTPYTIRSLTKINTVDPNLPWGNWGQSGETRTYVAPSYKYTCNGEILSLTNVQVNLLVPYSDEATMRANLIALGYPGAANWTGDLGTGDPVTGHGRADIDLVNTTAGFLAALDNGNHQVEFDIVTFDFLIQDQTGFYDLEIDVYPAAVEENVANLIIDIPELPFNFPAAAAHIEFDILAATAGGFLGDQTSIQVNEFRSVPDGVVPPGIAEIAGKFWRIGTTLNSINTAIIFDMSDLLFGDPALWRILRRANEFADWTVWEDFSLLNPTTIRANNVSEFSDWAIGKDNPVTLPIQLTSFTASPSGNHNVSLQWVTESESNLSGYDIYRNSQENLEQATNLNQFITPYNSSITHTYNFTDDSIIEPGTYYYWLCAVELNGSTEFFGPVSAQLLEPGEESPPPIVNQQSQIKIYPNPFNPDTQIAIYLNEANTANCRIYNHRGELVNTLPSSQLNSGWNYLNWNGRDSKGNPASSGIYFVQVKGQGLNLRAKLMLIK